MSGKREANETEKNQFVEKFFNNNNYAAQMFRNISTGQPNETLLQWAVRWGYSTVVREVVSKTGILTRFGAGARLQSVKIEEKTIRIISQTKNDIILPKDECKDDAEREKMVNMLDEDGLSIFDLAMTNLFPIATFSEIMDPDGIFRKSGFNRFFHINTNTGETTLHYAAAVGDNFRLLYNHLKNEVMDLEQLVDALCAADNDGKTILHSRYGNPESIEEIFSALMDCFDRVSQDPSLSESAKEEMKNRLRELPFRMTKYGKTILTTRRSEECLRKTLESLMKHDEMFSKESIRDFVNAVDSKGQTLLFDWHNAQFVEELTLRSGKEAGFDSILAVDIYGNTALQAGHSVEAMIAILNVCKDDEEKTTLLRSKNHHGKNLFHTTYTSDCVSYATISIDDISILRSMLMTMDDRGNIPLHCIRGRDVTETLIATYERCGILGVAMNMYNTEGLAPLHVAMKWKNDAQWTTVPMLCTRPSFSSPQRIARMDVDPNIATKSRLVIHD